MILYTIGFAKKSASVFFGLLKEHGIKQLIDVRLNNVSQLAGFTKRDDLAYFLKAICDADYRHEPKFAPTAEMLREYRELEDWSRYEAEFVALMRDRHIEDVIDRAEFAQPSVLLCSEAAPEQCHRRLVAEYLAERWGDLQVRHI
ncbi:MAG: DUF488 domain-containing protein [Armatimonadetes bacterium]|nr:DUF488 domain-containing protein [Armatimonadota bacterium]